MSGSAASNPAPRKRYLSSLLLIVSSIAACLLGEGLVRLFFTPPQLVFVEHATGISPDRGSEPELYYQTPTGRRIHPNLRATIHNHRLSGQTVEIRTNALGYRNPEIQTREKDRSKNAPPRVLFLGDSITLADYLPEEETFVRQVEMIARKQGRPLETINAGVGAVSLQEELAILLETGLKTNPDKVVLGFYLNDFRPSPFVKILRPPPLLRRSWLAYYIARAISYTAVDQKQAQQVQDEEIMGWFKEVWETLPGSPPGAPAAAKRTDFHRAVLKTFGDWGLAWSPRAWRRSRPVFAELKRQSRLHDFQLYFVIFPVDRQVHAGQPNTFPQDQLRQIAAELDVPLLDVLPVLRASRGPDRLFYDQCHHTARGSRVIAESLYSFLEDAP